MYAIEIYSGVGMGTTQDVLFPPTITLQGWNHRINAPGKLVFTMNKHHPKATRENLRKHRQVRLFRQPRGGGAMVPVWYGYIEAEQEIGDRKSIICAGMLEFFRKRETGEAEEFNGEGSTEAFGLLSDTNTYGETGVAQGTGGVTSTATLTMGHQTILSAWETLAEAHNAEFEIDPNGAFNFVSSLGTDKSLTVELTFRRDGEPGTNLDDIEIGEDAKDMVTRVIGTTTGDGGLTSIYTDPDSPGEYGDGIDDLILVDRKAFNQAQDQTTLDSITAAYGSQMANPLTETRVKPTLARKRVNPITLTRTFTGLDYDDVEVGDLVTVIIVTGNESLSEVKRVAELTVSVNDNGKEEILYTLSKSGVFVTADYLESRAVTDIKERLKMLENS